MGMCEMCRTRDVPPFPFLHGRTEAATPLSWESYIQHTWEWEEEMSGPRYGGRDGYSQA